MGHIAYRASSEAALMRRVAAIEASNMRSLAGDDDQGQGRAFRFADPLATYLKFTTIPYAIRLKRVSALVKKNLAQRYHGRGASPAASITLTCWQQTF
ncbi:hypothetical protein O3W44_20480 [Pantoea sp. LMR881]|uniref:hypothetical protein n=1 Tax=Pantoea sp. LMR881 TaxID=3014336 RepID=UPI0022AEF858|nr:hypothetical protein [Pantoea sp. LMR881]MCZ4060943.1 hypothetical protein [Pantoea sp. LMR881]